MVMRFWTKLKDEVFEIKTHLQIDIQFWEPHLVLVL